MALGDIFDLDPAVTESVVRALRRRWKKPRSSALASHPGLDTYALYSVVRQGFISLLIVRVARHCTCSTARSS